VHRASVHHERSVTAGNFRGARGKAGRSGRGDYSRVVWGLVHPQFCRAVAGRQACSRTFEDQTGSERGWRRSGSVSSGQQILPRPYRAKSREGCKQDSVLESPCAWDSVHGWDGAADHQQPRTAPSPTGETSARLRDLPEVAQEWPSFGSSCNKRETNVAGDVSAGSQVCAWLGIDALEADVPTTSASGRNECLQQAETGRPATKVTSKVRSQDGQREDQSALHAGQHLRIFCTPSRDEPFIRRSRTKRHLALIQIKKRAMGNLLAGRPVNSPVQLCSQYRRNT
jgi:hypothetical protein